MRIRQGVAAIAVSLLASGCVLMGPQTTTDPTTAFCDSVADYAAAVLDFQSLDASNTIDEYQAGAVAIEDAMASVADAARVMAVAEVEELDAATDALVSSVRDLPEDVPIEDIQAQVQQQVVEVAKARLSLGSAFCSTEALPTAAPAASAVPSPAAS